MLIITADGPSSGQHRSWEISEDDSFLLGRVKSCQCSVPWDDAVSRKHAELRVVGQALSVRSLKNDSYPIWKDGQTYKETTVEIGEKFRIGHTWFNVQSMSVSAPALDFVEQLASDDAATTSMLLSPADIRVSVVAESATELWKTATDNELAQEGLKILHQVLNFADLLVMLSCKDIQSSSRPRIVHWHKNKSGVKAKVSRELIAQALKEGTTAVEVDSDALGGAIKSGRWSFCVPVKSDADEPWCIYVGGAFGADADHGPFLTPKKLSPDANVTQLVGHLIGAVRSVRSLENRFDGVRQFFSPRVLDSVSADNPDAPDLEPRETDVVAIYCDLRGFSRMVSEGSDDLHGLLNRISAALSVMTHNIIEQEGVIADFQGDSALGFWGWPLALVNGPIPACRAALQIQRIFQKAATFHDHDLEGFRVGIGIASGRAIAGRIGTRDHAKIGVFGPVVNVASRLEGLTKKIGASILMDHETAVAVRDLLPAEEGRVRPIASMQPSGFDHAFNVSELLPGEANSNLSNGDLENFVDAAIAFRTGKWDKCRKLLALLPADDRTRDFLLVQIAMQNYQPPPDWQGVIKFDGK